MLKIISWFIILFTFIHTQDISPDYWQSQYLHISQDYGLGWETNTTYKPFRWEKHFDTFKNREYPAALDWLFEYFDKELFSGDDKPVQSKVWLGGGADYLQGQGGSYSGLEYSLYGYFQLRYKKRAYLHYYPRLTTNPESQPHYTGIPRDIRRLGLNSGAVDMSVIGYHNDLLTVEVARGRQNWGSDYVDNLALSAHSAAYDYGLLELHYKRVKARYFHGFLETIWNDGDYNRYITGRGLEYSNGTNFVISASEVVIYSGLDRPLDVAYLNPLLLHLDVELNNRTNRAGTEYDGANAIWQLSVDWLALRKLRVSGSLVIDEFQFDEADLEQGRPHSLAYQLRVAYSTVIYKTAVTYFAKYTRVDTYTFRHSDGYNNFVSRGLPLGSELGSDTDRWIIGFRSIFPFRVISEIQFGVTRSGEGNILDDNYSAYEQFTSVPFPSGVVDNTRFVDWCVSYRPKRTLEFELTFRYADSSLDNNQNYILLSCNGYWPFHFSY
jgi:hypothetical protein